jgi:enhancing lycopene biosynthesis protein 2
MKKVGVVLSGCGVFDGAEIHESVLTLLALDRAGAQAICLAPDTPQAKVTDHLRGADGAGTRNVLVEAARIARGEIRDLDGLQVEELDALILPGGFGVALNLSDFAANGASCTVHPGVERLVTGMVRAARPVGALCIAPVVLARILQKAGIRARLTIGNDPAVAAAIEAMGQLHVDCPAAGVIVDEKNRIVTSPAYMLAARISEVAAGAEALVREVLGLARDGC